MKKPTIFNSSEKELLIVATQMSLQSAVNFPNQLSRIERLANEVLSMLKSDWDHYYPSECVNYLERVLTEYLKPYTEKMKQLLDTPLSKILELQQAKSMDFNVVERCNSILGKLGRRKLKTNFMDVLSRINGIQNKSVENIARPSSSFEWEPVAKSETMLFDLIPGESNASNSNNSFIDLITEDVGYREVA